MSDDASIATLSRQTGLLQTVSTIANNIANASTPGYKSEGTVFSEYIRRTGPDSHSLSMGRLSAQTTDFSSGSLRKTGGDFDYAIDGTGFFKVATPDGDRLTRAGRFMLDLDGQIVDPNGAPVLDGGGAPIEIPQDATVIAVGRDGTLSIDGEPYGDIGVFEPVGQPERAGNNYWTAPGGDRPVEEPNVLQGFAEQSNVSPVSEFAALIAAQRNFDAGQTLTEQEHERLSALIAAIRQGA
ncbi:flagellar hook-basal body complex protein [Parvularcula oceani]|uniref:flagellar hook-basal body complex protein n=1 Tax=Parvularcula oceani TaxID=1247963 RepID=UPI0004E12B78|nr:flagellar hook-basal body complex protein [Parvularcula oceani]